MNSMDVPDFWLEAPERCAGCPALCDLAQVMLIESQAKDADQQIATEFVMSEPPEEIVSMMSDLFSVPSEEVQTMVRQAQQQTAKHLETSFVASEEREKLTRMAARTLIENCDGKLELSGETKRGQAVAVTVCGSLVAPIDPSVTEHVHVTRD